MQVKVDTHKVSAVIELAANVFIRWFENYACNKCNEYGNLNLDDVRGFCNVFRQQLYSAMYSKLNERTPNAMAKSFFFNSLDQWEAEFFYNVLLSTLSHIDLEWMSDADKGCFVNLIGDLKDTISRFDLSIDWIGRVIMFRQSNRTSEFI